MRSWRRGSLFLWRGGVNCCPVAGGADALDMGQQRTLGHGPHARGHIAAGVAHPVFGRAVGLGLHGGQHFRFARQAVGFELGDGAPRIVQHIAVCGQG